MQRQQPCRTVNYNPTSMWGLIPETHMYNLYIYKFSLNSNTVFLTSNIHFPACSNKHRKEKIQVTLKASCIRRERWTKLLPAPSLFPSECGYGETLLTVHWYVSCPGQCLAHMDVLMMKKWVEDVWRWEHKLWCLVGKLGTETPYRVDSLKNF